MKLLSLLVVSLMPLVAPVLAAPAPAPEAAEVTIPPFPPVANETALAKRTPGNVHICTGPNWTPPCDTFSLGITGTCWSIPSPYAYNAGSVGPDQGAICRLFDDSSPTCTGSGLAQLQYPGNSNLYFPTLFPGYKARYWKCNECTNCW
ncbi:hypothetical protein MFIFM68171_08293 [Madurella fahalii]|uniref:Uncharacterized protein n=1 Tax=Madurella fahalii TaxID=1157608 RepID=A0ABQ0GJZ3_9PEZI